MKPKPLDPKLVHPGLQDSPSCSHPSFSASQRAWEASASYSGFAGAEVRNLLMHIDTGFSLAARRDSKAFRALIVEHCSVPLGSRYVVGCNIRVARLGLESIRSLACH